jgi:putative addiction module CopG family antidote
MDRMAVDRQITVTLSPEAAEFVRRKVATGDFPDESAVIREGLDLLEDRDRNMEQWLREEVVPACLEFEADSSTAISSSEVLAELDQVRPADHKKSA